MPKITKRTVDASTPRGTRYYVWDTEIRGFGLLILPTGIKSYIYQYRTPQGRSRRATIGKHGTFTPDEARRRASDMRQAVIAGHDPLGEKTALLQALTVAQLLDAYVASERFAGNTQMTQSNDRGRIERHLKPLLGRKHVDALTRGEIERAHAAIRVGKTAGEFKTGFRGLARVTGGEGAARMSIWLLRAACTWAVAERLIKVNPCLDIKTAAIGTRETIVENTADYARLFQTLERMESEQRIRRQVADAIRLIALTGARRGEVAALKWSHVDLKRRQITLPANAHKTGKNTGKPRVIGLPSVAEAIIAKQPAGDADDYVFAPAHGDGPISLSKPWRAIRTAAGLPEALGLHGLRHSLASHMAMQGAEAAAIMNALGHRQLSTSQRYVHWAKDARQALAERAAAVPLAGLALSSPNAAQIVPLKAKASKRGR